MALKNCPYCGSLVSDNATECPKCGASLTMSYSTQYDQQAAPSAEYMKKFNWGALLLNWIWGIGNGMWWLFIPLFIVDLIPAIGGILGLGGCIYLGVKGNELSWKFKEWRSVEDFYEAQARWKKWAIYLYAGVIGFFIFAILCAIAIDS